MTQLMMQIWNADDESVDLEALKGLQMPLGEKAAACANLIKRQEQRANLIKRSCQQLREYLRQGMENAGIKTVGDDHHKLQLVKSEKVRVEDPSRLPPQFIVEVPATVKPDTKAIRKHIKQTGELLDGVEFEVVYYLRVT